MYATYVCYVCNKFAHIHKSVNIPSVACWYEHLGACD